MPVDQSKLTIRMLKNRLRTLGRCTRTRFGQPSCTSDGLYIGDRCAFCQDEAVVVWLVALRDENRVLHERLGRTRAQRRLSATPAEESTSPESAGPGSPGR